MSSIEVYSEMNIVEKLRMKMTACWNAIVWVEGEFVLAVFIM